MNYEIIKFENNSLTLEVNVSPEEDTVWLSLNEMCLLFDRDKSVISRHIRNIFKENELNRDQTVAKNATVQIEGDKEVTRIIDYYNLDVIISVGYRVKSPNGVIFRKWATSILKEYLIKGYAIDKNRTLVTDENYINLINHVHLLDNKISEICKRQKHLFIEDKIIFDNQLFDGIVLMNRIVETANSSIILIDPYVDVFALDLFKNKKKNVQLKIITSSKHKIGNSVKKAFNREYGNLVIKIDNRYHDRYFIIDNEVFYHFGTSVNYIGKRLSQITRIQDNDLIEILRRREKESV